MRQTARKSMLVRPEAGVRKSRLRSADVWSLALLGLKGRPVRAKLSAAGIAFGVATLVTVLGISSSSRAQLLANIDALGTNLLTVTSSQSFSGQTVTLPRQAPAMIRHIGPVLADSAIGDVGANVEIYRNDRVPVADTNAITVFAAQTSLLSTLQGHVARGRFLNGATEHFPAVVLGATTSRVLGVDRADGSTQLWLGDHWFTVIGILQPLSLAPELDRSALVGFPVAERSLGADGSPVEIYVRTDPTNVHAVASVLASTTDPAAPQDVSVSNPIDALIARAEAGAAFESLFVALGAVALLVGGVGIANVMVIAVLERRSEIGLRRALGATKTHVGVQFLCESALLALIGGLAGAVAGGFTTTVYAAARHWYAVIPPTGLAAAAASAVAVGAVAGLYPAARAARLTPSDALKTV
jgi:putative ABC transport system permease protein